MTKTYLNKNYLPSAKNLALLKKLVELSVDLQNLNAVVQRKQNISIVQWLVLKNIVEQPGLSASSLAEISGVHPSTLTPTINRLESTGLIFLLERPTDMRRKLIVTSWKGLEYYRKAESFFSSILGETISLKTIEAHFDQVSDFASALLNTIQSDTKN